MATQNDYSTFAFLLQGYQTSDQAIHTTNVNKAYYGFLDRFGAWYIQEHTRTGSGVGSTMTYRYVKGSSGFDTNWAARQSLAYTRWDVTYK